MYQVKLTFEIRARDKLYQGRIGSKSGVKKDAWWVDKVNRVSGNIRIKPKTF